MEAAWSGISNLNNHPIEGVTDTELDLDEFKLFFFTPEAPKGKNLPSRSFTERPAKMDGPEIRKVVLRANAGLSGHL